MFAAVEIKMDGSFFGGIIAIGTGSVPKYDDKIFYYVDSQEDLEALMKEDNGEDFCVTQIYEYYDSLEELYG